MKVTDFVVKAPRGLSPEDKVNFTLLMKRLAEGKDWLKLLDQPWDNKMDLLDAAEDHIPSRQQRAKFRKSIERLWGVAS